MRRNIIIGVSVVVLLVIVGLVCLSQCGDNNSERSDKEIALQAELDHYKRIEAAKDSLLKVKEAARQDSIQKADFTKEIIAAVMDSCNCKPKKPTKKTTPKKEVVYTAPVPAPVVTPVPVVTPPVSAPAPVKEESYSPSTGLDDIYYEGKDRNIYFCVNYDGNPGWHLPHLAMLTGTKFGEKAVSNNQSGYNFKIAPENISIGFKGDFGVTTDGIFYVKEDFVDSYNPDSDVSIYIKTTATGWQLQEMKLDNGYYIFKR